MKACFITTKNFILDLLFPSLCLGCGKEGSHLCPLCQRNLHAFPPTCFLCKRLAPIVDGIAEGRTCPLCRKKTRIYGFFSPYSYQDPLIKDLVHGCKYKRIKAIGTVMGNLIADYVLRYKADFPENTIITPIPLHRSRQRERGFNQADLIGLQLSLRLHLSLDSKNLYRAKKTMPQTELSAEERTHNIVGAFGIHNIGMVENKNIILVDDVRTTGSTLEEAARVLKLARAQKVWAVTFAH